MRGSKAELRKAAGRVAEAVLGLVAGGGVAERLLREYARRHNRPALLASPPHRAELIEALERECLLLVTMRIDARMRRRLAAQPTRGRIRAADSADVFREELLAHLARAREWDAGASYEFRRDLALYFELAAPPPAAARQRPRKLGERTGGPFVDRCALLLDPSLFDKARAAAARLAAELESDADALLARLLRRRTR
jgi:hypothetical protein